MTSFQTLERQVEQLCSEIADNPEAQQKLREKFYRKYKLASQDGIDYGRFELAFFAHQVARGVVNPPDAMPPGSQWWRKMYCKYIYFSQLAAAVSEAGGVDEVLPLPVKRWLKFIKKPSPKLWFRAFNTTFLTCANLYRADALLESDFEQFYINTILYRLMYAQAMAEDAEMFGDQSVLGEKMDSFCVNVVTHMSNLPPAESLVDDFAADLIEDIAFEKPSGLEAEFVAEVEDKLESVGAALFGHEQVQNQHEQDQQIQCKELSQQVETLDSQIILPHLTRLYDNVAKWDDVPFIADWCQNGKPVYPAV